MHRKSNDQSYSRTHCKFQKTGSTNVLSSAVLLGLMENASVNALSTVCLVCGQNTVGHRITLDHFKPSAVGSTITAVAKITEVDFRGIQFEIEAFDETGLVGKGKCSRVFVDQDEFERRCYDRHRKVVFQNE